MINCPAGWWGRISPDKVYWVLGDRGSMSMAVGNGGEKEDKKMKCPACKSDDAFLMLEQNEKIEGFECFDCEHQFMPEITGSL